jgi:solute carrier family 7 (cationic amino acid transporter), member 14
MKFSIPTPGGGSGMTLFSKLIRTKDLRKLQGDDPKSNKPKLTVNLISLKLPVGSIIKQETFSNAIRNV